MREENKGNKCRSVSETFDGTTITRERNNSYITRPSLIGIVHTLPRVVFDTTVLLGLIVWNALLFYSITKHNMTDFGKFYYSVVAFLQGQDMYGPTVATLNKMGLLQLKELWNLNPPHFHLLILPLGLLSPTFALTLWSLASLFCFVVSLRLILQELYLKITPWQRRLTLVCLLGFSGTAGVLVTGQLSFLLLLPITLAWIAARQGRWTNAGICLGLVMSVKLFLLTFLPYLFVRRQFRAAIMACCVALLCFHAGLLMFGVDAYVSWLRVLPTSSDWAWMPMSTSAFGFIARALEKNSYYAPFVKAADLVTPIWLIFAGLAGILTLVALSSKSLGISVDRDFALLLLASQLISPLGWVYYLWFPIGPLSALAVSWWSNSKREEKNALPCWYSWRNTLAFVGIVGLLWPIQLTTLFQPSSWATISVASIYFWATFVLWLSSA